VTTFGPGKILTPAEWEKASRGALRRHDEALRAQLAAALRLIGWLADGSCTCPDGLHSICPACRCRAFLGTPPSTPARSPRLPQPDAEDFAE